MLKSTIARVVGVSVRRPWVVIVLALVVTLAAGSYAATHWTVNTDTMRIMPDSLPWRRTQIAYERAFPPSAILAVVEAPTAELTDLATETLMAALSTQHDRFHSVHRAQDDLFLRREALLFRSPAQVAQTARQLGGAQPLFAELAADPTLRGAAGALIFGERAVEGGQAKPEGLTRPMQALSDTLDDVFAGRFASFSWRTLMGGPEPADSRRGFIQIDPVLDTHSLQPGHAATAAIEQAAARTDIAGRFGATLRLTGTAPINDQQFSTLQRESKWTLLGTALAVLVILWLALRSGRIILAVALSLGAGFAVTAALGLLMVGSFNLISVAFAVLFVGLGADFGIQFSVRYRSERHDHDEVHQALRGAALKAGVPLLLATAGTAAGFFSFLPTAYRGMAELGQIAGVGMLAAFTMTLTLLPALLTVLKPPGEPDRLGFKALAPVDRFLAAHRVAVVAGTIGVVLLASPLLLRLRLDFDATHMQPPNAPAVRAYHQLARDPLANIQAINVAAPSLAAARTLAERLRGLKQVSEVRTVDVLVPADQAAKLPLVERAAVPLGPALMPREVKPAPTDADDIAAIRQAATGLAPIERDGGDAGAAAHRLRPLLLRLAEADVETRRRAATALVVPLRADLALLRDMLRPEHASVSDVPAELRRDWLAPDGQARVEVVPRGDANDTRTMARFARAVLAVAPEASGAPVALVGSERTVTHAFLEAGAVAVLSIAAILWVTLRRLGDVLLTLLPLLVAALVTLELVSLIGEPLNFANIIALPLLLGVGVAFKIYYITAWRAGATHLLETALTRAIVFSSLTTATAFGSLWLSSQPGLSSMGKLMALALACTLAAAVLFQPALMGPPRKRTGTGPEPEF